MKSYRSIKYQQASTIGMQSNGLLNDLRYSGQLFF